MKKQPAHEDNERRSIFSAPNSKSDPVFYLSDQRVEELDPVDITVPDREIVEPKKIAPIGNLGNNESPSNVDGAIPKFEPVAIDGSEIGNEDSTAHPIASQTT